MSYKPNRWNRYNKRKSFRENLENDAVVTAKKLNHMEQGIKEAHDNFNIGIGTVTSGDKAAVSITKKDCGCKKINFVLPKGEKGDTGLSSYELAKLNGYEGSLEDWLETLKGEQGIQGPQGEKGENGVTPEKGVDYFTQEDIQEMTMNVIKSKKTSPYVDDTTKVLYACGVHVIIDESNIEGKTKASWYGLDGKKTEILFDSTYTVCGGGDGLNYAVYYPATCITMNSGTVNAICGGNYGEGAVGNSIIIVNGGSFQGWNGPCGGGYAFHNNQNYKNTVGHSEIIINDNNGVIGNVYGACPCGMGSVGTSKITINGGSIQRLTAGGYDGETCYTYVEVNGGMISSIQGCNRGHVSNIEVLVDAGSITKLYAGAETGNGEANGTYDRCEIIVTGGKITTISSGTNGGVENTDKICGEYVSGIIGNEELAPSLNMVKIGSVEELSEKAITSVSLENGTLTFKSGENTNVEVDLTSSIPQMRWEEF